MSERSFVSIIVNVFTRETNKSLYKTKIPIPSHDFIFHQFHFHLDAGNNRELKQRLGSSNRELIIKKKTHVHREWTIQGHPTRI